MSITQRRNIDLTYRYNPPRGLFWLMITSKSTDALKIAKTVWVVRNRRFLNTDVVMMIYQYTGSSKLQVYSHKGRMDEFLYPIIIFILFRRKKMISSSTTKEVIFKRQIYYFFLNLRSMISPHQVLHAEIKNYRID